MLDKTADLRLQERVLQRLLRMVREEARKRTQVLRTSRLRELLLVGRMATVRVDSSGRA